MNGTVKISGASTPLPLYNHAEERAWAIKEALYLPGDRLDVLETVVLLADAQPTGTDSQGGKDGLQAHRQHRDLLPASSDECDERGAYSKTQKIKSMACGFRNTENIKPAIYFYCCGLDRFPCRTRERPISKADPVCPPLQKIVAIPFDGAGKTVVKTARGFPIQDSIGLLGRQLHMLDLGSGIRIDYGDKWRVEQATDPMHNIDDFYTLPIGEVKDFAVQLRTLEKPLSQQQLHVYRLINVQEVTGKPSI